MNKANDILGNWSRAMRLTWCTMCPHPPSLSWVSKCTAVFVRLPDIQCFNPGVRLPYERGRNTETLIGTRLLLSFASLVTKVGLGQRRTLYIISYFSPVPPKPLLAFLVAGKFYGISSLPIVDWPLGFFSRWNRIYIIPRGGGGGTPLKVLYGKAPAPFLLASGIMKG